ncbi:MAG: M36 family metallopeptidase [Acidobacteriota bacterium]|nr:M36 family metallopeptidase [Acidobacteriota bacterium]
MRLCKSLSASWLAVLCLLLAVPASAGFLTAPSPDDPLDIVTNYLEANGASMGLTQDDLAEWTVNDRYTTRHNGVTHIYLQQRLDGIPVYNGLLNVSIDNQGRIFFIGDRWVRDLAGSVVDRAPSLDAVDAIHRSANHLGLRVSDALVPLGGTGGPVQNSIFSEGGLSQDEIPVELVYQPLDDGTVRLAWNTVLRLHDDENWWNVRVDATNGEFLAKNNWIAADSYRVFPLPMISPDDVGPGHVVVNDPANATASPFGWHDTNGAAGAEFTDTRGNNVEASEDSDANNVPGFRPSGGAGLDFDFAWDPGLSPTGGTNQEAAIVNLFYWNNIVHDVLYHYGFDEAGGNFQQNNYGNGGVGGDPVQADAQDGSGTNNANFGTPPDGSDPRMQMFIWVNPLPNILEITAPGTIAGNYAASGAGFGPGLDTTGISGDVVLVDDGTGTTSDGCEAITNGGAVSGNIALIDRGSCSFVTKTRNAQNVGATAVVIVNNQGDTAITLGDDGTGGDITIPAGMIGQGNGDIIKAELPGVTGTFKNGGGSVPDRDSDMDNGVIIHEYGHGVSNRLTGGPSAVGCLGNTEQMGEGWSDWLALALTGKVGDQPEDQRGIAPYLVYQPVDGPGIRQFPYTTDISINTHTYGDVGGVSVPHGVGSIWSAMLWEVYWNMVDRYGFDADIYNGTGGNNRAIQLVMDGMKTQTCLPGFEDGRDGILAADLANNGGANECLIWRGFAKRGMGVSADQGSNNSVADGAQAFDIPLACEDFIYEDGFESGDTGAWDNVKDDFGDLTVTAGAALVGTMGGQFNVDTSKVFLEDFTPSSEGSYKARFYIDPSSVTMPDGKRMKIIQLFSDGPSRRLATGVLRFKDGGFRFLFKIHNDDNSWTKVGFFDLDPGVNVVEVAFYQSTGAGNDDGALELFLNEVSVGRIDGVDNDLDDADRVRFGIVSKPKAGYSGTLLLDAFESRRFTHIGLAAP